MISQTHNPIFLLPPNFHSDIASHLTVKEVYHLSSVSKFFRDFFNKEEFWENRMRREWGETTDFYPASPFVTWKKACENIDRMAFTGKIVFLSRIIWIGNFHYPNRIKSLSSQTIAYSKQGKLYGQAHVIYPDKREEKGNFDNGYLNGPGIKHFSAGSDEGNFREGRLHGVGKKIYAGQKMEGEFRRDKMHGRIKLTTSQGKVVSRTFDHGRLLPNEVSFLTK